MGRIPDTLHCTYVRYKQDTRAIINWLLGMSHGARKDDEIATLTIRDLLGLAQIVQKKAVIMPDTIDFHFRYVFALYNIWLLIRLCMKPGGYKTFRLLGLFLFLPLSCVNM